MRQPGFFSTVVRLTASEDNPRFELDHQRYGDAGDADEVDAVTGMYHLRDRDIARGIDDSIRRSRDREHEAERCREGDADSYRDWAQAGRDGHGDGERADHIRGGRMACELGEQQGHDGEYCDHDDLLGSPPVAVTTASVGPMSEVTGMGTGSVIHQMATSTMIASNLWASTVSPANGVR